MTVDFFKEEWTFDDLIRIIKMGGRLPDYVLKGGADGQTHRVGVAYLNKDGTLTVELDKVRDTAGNRWSLIPVRGSNPPITEPPKPAPVRMADLQPSVVRRVFFEDDKRRKK